jgi:hypothetical protein
MLMLASDEAGGRETWVDEGSDSGWRLIAGPADSPTVGGLMAHDSSTGRTLLYGTSDRKQWESWEFDDEAGWLPIPIQPTQPNIVPAGLVFDASRGRSVLFGQGQTWEWNSQDQSWSDRTPDSPSPTSLAGGMAYDSARAQAMFIGRNEAWTWDGTEWHDVTPIAGAPTRDPDDMVYDPTTDRLVFQSDGGTWLLDAGGRPAHRIDVPLTPLTPGGEIHAIDAVTIVARVGASGVNGGAALQGAALQAWDTVRWTQVACNRASSAAPDELVWTVTDPDQINRMEVEGALHLALTPVALYGKPLATLTTDYVEVHIRYHLGDTTPVGAPQAMPTDYVCAELRASPGP